MSRWLFATVLILFLSVSYAYSHMHEGGPMMGETKQGMATSPGYGMMGPGYGGHMMGAGCGGHMMGQGVLGFGTEEENRKFIDDTVDLRREMHNKKFEFSEALRRSDTSRKTLLKLKKEILEIKVKMYERALRSE